MARGKRLSKIYTSIDSRKMYPVAEAVKTLLSFEKVKFDATVDISINLNVDVRHADQQVRSRVVLPSGSGKVLRVAVFAKGDKAQIARDAGADLVGAEDFVEKIASTGVVDFDRCIATPDMMQYVGRLGKVLGPKNLMPNPKLGTVTLDVERPVKAAKGGEVQFRTEKAGIVHAGIGKLSMGETKITENVESFIKAVRDNRPSGAKGAFIKSAHLSSSMGPGIRIDINGIFANKRSE